MKKNNLFENFRSILQFFLLILTLLFTSCNKSSSTEVLSDSLSNFVLISNKSSVSEASFLTSDHKGNPVLTWVEKSIKGVFLYYAISLDTGRTFGVPVRVPTTKGLSSHNESMPKIAFKRNGDAVVVFQKRKPTSENQYAGVLLYTQLLEGSKKWSNPKMLHSDTSSGIGRNFFDITRLPDGEIGAIWLDGRNKYENGSSVYFAKTNAKNGFDSEIQIGEKTCQCCRTDIYVDHKDNINVAYRDILKDSIRDIVHIISKDLGNTFSLPVVISEDNWVLNGCPHSGPVMAETSSGLDFFWFTRGGGTGVYHTSKEFMNQNFKKRDLINSQARHPQAASLSKDEVAIVWDEYYEKTDFYCNRIRVLIKNKSKENISNYITSESINALYPAVLKLNNGNLLISWTQKIDGDSQVCYKQYLR